MNIYYVILTYVSAFLIFVIIHKMAHNKKPVKRALLSFLTGFTALVIVNITSIFTGVYLPFSLLSITVSTIGGIPGVTALLALNLFF